MTPFRMRTSRRAVRATECLRRNPGHRCRPSASPSAVAVFRAIGRRARWIPSRFDRQPRRRAPRDRRLRAGPCCAVRRIGHERRHGLRVWRRAIVLAAAATEVSEIVRARRRRPAVARLRARVRRATSGLSRLVERVRVPAFRSASTYCSKRSRATAATQTSRRAAGSLRSTCRRARSTLTAASGWGLRGTRGVDRCREAAAPLGSLRARPRGSRGRRAD